MSNRYNFDKRYFKRRRPQIMKMKLKFELVFEGRLRNEIDYFTSNALGDHGQLRKYAQAIVKNFLIEIDVYLN
ncbi:MAG: hypothetical protein ACM3X1_01945 [Ignavibacteriales bacterium]